MKKEQFDITGMTCSACSARVEQCVAKLPGVAEASVNLLKNSMAVSYDEGALDPASIVALWKPPGTARFRKSPPGAAKKQSRRSARHRRSTTL